MNMTLIKMEELKKRDSFYGEFVPMELTSELKETNFESDDIGLDLEFILFDDFLAETVPCEEEASRVPTPEPVKNTQDTPIIPSHHRSYRDYALARWREKRKRR